MASSFSKSLQSNMNAYSSFFLTAVLLEVDETAGPLTTHHHLGHPASESSSPASTRPPRSSTHAPAQQHVHRRQQHPPRNSVRHRQRRRARSTSGTSTRTCRRGATRGSRGRRWNARATRRRLVVVAWRAYVEKYRPAFQTRDVFTLWGILQLLARYPGRVPDLDLMFFCDDTPEVHAAAYPDPSMAPPLFMYCKNDSALGIVLPDWTFGGWPEVNIRPWAPFLEEVAREIRLVPWLDREPYAFWKGNPDVGGLPSDLMRCNASDNGKDWNARHVRQDWEDADWNGFKDSNLARQCTYTYKIYVQGRTWSVSQKYILACGSPMLRIDTPFHDFFSRGLVASKHYWPIDAARMCPSIKSAVDWGNAHPVQAQRMGEEGSSFARDELSMDYVYDYMLRTTGNEDFAECQDLCRA
ncbi:hypothetical protein GQ55_3G328600 [Panicum hallii var. hallii]|uniref:Glycosyl transferase CAP10 domain-containing protein n=1 Tax=Panicum hallii var. hallii TaxID=1504633 RepID=A0A2T7EFH1_9POAL|nr:hypothetical protein GQ55_3G328600 [Panicum hallii var. hallii]